MHRLLPALLVFSSWSISAAQITDQDVDEYLVATLEHALATQNEALEQWKSLYADLGGTNIVQELIGYQPPNFLALTAEIAAHLYTRTGERRYAEIARDLLVEIPDLRRYFPERFRTRVEYEIGVPAVNWFRTFPVYAKAFMDTRGSGVYSEEDVAAVREAVASSVNIIFAFPEWGAMNRALLRAESLMAAYRAFPDDPDAAKWHKMAVILAEDSIGKWEIEDASIYHAVWLRSYINYLDLAGRTDVFDSPIFRFYPYYLVSLQAPDGTIPEFGDGRWATPHDEYYAVMERAATEFQSGEIKWSAHKMLEYMGGIAIVDGSVRKGPAFDTPSVGFARSLIDRRAYGDPDLAPSEPAFTSGDAIDEVMAKKIVFRSGWDPDAAYLLLNYKDEGYYSLMQKNYLKHVLAVEEEKMHHGHSDENGISMFMKDGTILLYDGGYRPFAPSGPFGAWRSDYFHNRIVVRNERKAANQGYFDVLRNSGAYNDAVRTAKIDFQAFDPVEYSRTRVKDQKTGYEWDRVLVRDVAEDFFIMVDAVRFQRSDYYTVVNILHTRQILDSGDGWFVTRYDSLAGMDPNPGDLRLLVVFPYERDTGTEAETRSHQTETALFQAVSQYFEAGRIEPFVTILYPIEPGEDAEAIASRFRLIRHDEDAVALSIERGGRSEIVGVKLDMNRDLVREDIRPRYTYESGRLAYGDAETDADFLHVALGADGRPRFAATHLVRFDYAGETIFDTPESQFFQVWGRSDLKGRAKWRRWDNY